MRGRNLVKLLSVIELLAKPAGATISEIAEHLEVDRRSVYRIMDVIQELGFPVYDEKIYLEKEKRWKFMDSYLKKLPNMKIPDVNITLHEIISLYLIKGEARVFKGTEIERNIKSVFGKLGMFLPDDAYRRLNKIKALFIPTSRFVKDYSGKEEIIDQLMDAIFKQETCHIKYHSFYDDKMKDFAIDPLHFFENDGGLYVFVNTTDFGDVRTLAVERIMEITRTGNFFTYPENFDLEELLELAFDIVYENPIDVKIWFSADQARYIKERKWSKTQKIKEQKDGSIILSMHTSGRWDIRKWVLSYGAEAQVLEPEDLRNEISDELAAAQVNYK